MKRSDDCTTDATAARAAGSDEITAEVAAAGKAASAEPFKVRCQEERRIGSALSREFPQIELGGKTTDVLIT